MVSEVPPSSRRSSALPAARVLVCDDEARVAKITAELLQTFGLQPLTATSGEAALSYFAGSEPLDAMLLDVNLSSGLSARQVLERLAHTGRKVPVILTSGYPIEDVPTFVAEHSAVVAYLSKPYSMTRLIDAVRKAIGRLRPGDAQPKG